VAFSLLRVDEDWQGLGKVVAGGVAPVFRKLGDYAADRPAQARE
jgi:hypothetical protein